MRNIDGDDIGDDNNGDGWEAVKSEDGPKCIIKVAKRRVFHVIRFLCQPGTAMHIGDRGDGASLDFMADHNAGKALASRAHQSTNERLPFGPITLISTGRCSEHATRFPSSYCGTTVYSRI